MDSSISREDFWDLPRHLSSTGGEFITVFDFGFGNWITLGIYFVNDWYFQWLFLFLTLIMILRITFFSCGPARVSVSCWVKRNQSWRQQRILRLPGTQKVLQAAIWQRGTIQVQELERWLITEPPSPVWPCAIYYTAPLQAWFFSSVKWDQ